MPKEVTILTGFLGAGKTTFLNAVLDIKSDQKFAIIENEFGKESIDSDLIIKPELGIIELSNGCLCCSLNGNLYEILNELNTREAEFDQLIIETTGIADPAGVAEAFLTDPILKKAFPLARVICIVDAHNFEMQLQETEEAIKQLAFADLVLFNKTQELSKENLDKILNLISVLNPFAKVFVQHENDYKVAEIFASFRDSEFKSITLNEVKTGENLAFENIKESKVHKHGNIVSLSFKFDKPFNEKELQMRLYGYLVFEAKDLYRIKGIISGKDLPYRLILQSVSTSLSITGGKPWLETEDKISRIVFIGKNLEQKDIKELLEACLVI